MAGAAGSVSGTSSAFVPDEQSVEQLINFGFTRAQCVKALKSTTGNMERAADWLFNHPNDNGNYSSSMKMNIDMNFDLHIVQSQYPSIHHHLRNTLQQGNSHWHYKSALGFLSPRFQFLWMLWKVFHPKPWIWKLQSNKKKFRLNWLISHEIEVQLHDQMVRCNAF